VLKDFPRAGGVRLMMAGMLIRAGTGNAARLASAVALLQEGLDQLLTAEQVSEAKRLLESAGAKSESAETLERVRQLLAAASARARSAVEAWHDDRTPARLRAAMEELATARAEAEQAAELSAAAGLGAVVAKAKALVDELSQLRAGLEKG
jgi:site-specific recombinase